MPFFQRLQGTLIFLSRWTWGVLLVVFICLFSLPSPPLRVSSKGFQGVEARENRADGLDCALVYNPGNGWAIELCSGDPSVPEKMNVTLDGVAKGDAALMRIYHKSQNWSGSPRQLIQALKTPGLDQTRHAEILEQMQSLLESSA